MGVHRLQLDSGWLYLLSGLALLALVILLPAQDDLANLRWQEQRLAAGLEREQQRLRRYGEFIQAVDLEEPTVVRRLVGANLNLGDPQRRTVLMRVSPNRGDVSSWIEPQPVQLERPLRPATLLRRLLARDGLRPWLLAGASLCIFIGLLPPVREEADIDGDDEEPSETWDQPTRSSA
jgi:hypothetical protein